MLRRDVIPQYGGVYAGNACALHTQTSALSLETFAWIWCMRWVQIKNRLQSQKAHRSRKFISSTGVFLSPFTLSHSHTHSLGGPSLPYHRRRRSFFTFYSFSSVQKRRLSSAFQFDEAFMISGYRRERDSENGRNLTISVPVAGAFDSQKKKRLKICARWQLIYATMDFDANHKWRQRMRLGAFYDFAPNLFRVLATQRGTPFRCRNLCVLCALCLVQCTK